MSALVRAWRRPGAITLLWAYRALGAFLVALPLASAVGSTGVGALPGGDALLFGPGGDYLAETARLGEHAIAAAARSSALVLLGFATVGLVPLAALHVALVNDGRLRLGPWLAASIEHVPSFLLLSGIILVAQAATGAATAFAAGALGDAVAIRVNERMGTVAALSVAAVGAILFVLLGIALDLARAIRVRHGARPLRALGAGFRVLARRLGSATVGWLGPALWGSALVLAAAAGVQAVSVDLPGAWRPAAALLLHQLALLALAALRAVWVGRALELSGPKPAVLSDQPAIAAL